MSEGWSRTQRQTSMTYSGMGNLYVPPSSVTGSNRSRRPSWSDAKVLKKLCFLCLYFQFCYITIESLECR
jgi:hypothetical protein